MSKNRNGSGFIVGLVFGTAVGVVAGLLLSPRSGQENRASIANQFPEFRDRAPDVMNRVAEEVRSRLEQGREAFRDGAAETRARLQREFEEARQGERPTA
ncbi:MAG: hypothetical protein GEU73_08695 [Chloroflexi bacterium]|nr:hypothetical protein [Chloroflexota bacterium]